MKSILSQAYHWPYIHKTYAILHCLTIGFFTFSFCYWVRPFDLNEYIDSNQFFNVSIVTSAINIFIIGFINIFGVPKMFSQHFNHWTIGKEVFWTVLVIVLTCTISPFIMEYYYRANKTFSIQHYYDMVSWAFIGTSVPLIFSILINHMRIQLIKSNEIKLSLQENQEHKKPNIITKNEDTITIPTEKGDYILNLNNLIVIKANANFSEVYLSNPDNTSKQEKIRCTLTTIEKELTAYDHIFRSHRTFIVNVHKIDEYSGSMSKGFIVTNNCIDFPILVSRSKSDEFKKNPHLI